MTRTRTLLLVAVMAMSVSSCKQSVAPQHDVLMEAIANSEEVVNAPLARGKEVYSRYCSVCHGLEGRGDGFNAYNLKPAPRDFTDSTFIVRLDSGLVTEAVTKGGLAVGLSASMPPWGRTLSHADIRDVAKYVRHLARPDSGGTLP